MKANSVLNFQAFAFHRINILNEDCDERIMYK